MTHVTERISDQRCHHPRNLVRIERNRFELVLGLDGKRHIEALGLALQHVERRAQQASQIRGGAPNRQRLYDCQMEPKPVLAGT